MCGEQGRESDPIEEFRLIVEQLDELISALEEKVASNLADREDQRALAKHRGQRDVFAAELEAMRARRASG